MYQIVELLLFAPKVLLRPTGQTEYRVLPWTWTLLEVVAPARSTKFPAQTSSIEDPRPHGRDQLRWLQVVRVLYHLQAPGSTVVFSWPYEVLERSRIAAQEADREEDPERRNGGSVEGAGSRCSSILLMAR